LGRPDTTSNTKVMFYTNLIASLDAFERITSIALLLIISVSTKGNVQKINVLQRLLRNH